MKYNTKESTVQVEMPPRSGRYEPTIVREGRECVIVAENANGTVDVYLYPTRGDAGGVVTNAKRHASGDIEGGTLASASLALAPADS